jgi:hypothetical protein
MTDLIWVGNTLLPRVFVMVAATIVLLALAGALTWRKRRQAIVSLPSSRQRIEVHPGGWPRIHPYDGWRARAVEAWWTLTGRFTLHRAWQDGYDKHIQDESARRSRGGK